MKKFLVQMFITFVAALTAMLFVGCGVDNNPLSNSDNSNNMHFSGGEDVNPFNGGGNDDGDGQGNDDNGSNDGGDDQGNDDNGGNDDGNGCGNDSEIAINAQYIRSGYTYSPNDEWPLPAVVTIVTSRNELEQYYENHGRRFSDGFGNQLPDLDFLNAIEKYTDDYFTDNYLVIVWLIEGSGSIRHEVKKIDENGNIVINRLLPGIGTDDMASWSIAIERNNCFNVEQFQVELVDVELYGE
jgi:hypothetical protein